MAQNQEVGLQFQEREVLGGKVFKETSALGIIGHLRVQHSCHKDKVGLRIVMHAKRRGKHLLDPPKVYNCKQTTRNVFRCST